MKKGIHPDYHPIEVITTDGKSFSTRSTYGKAGAKLTLDIDPLIHPAWTKSTKGQARGDQVSRFKGRFGNLKL